jgi:hypothetical protein
MKKKASKKKNDVRIPEGAKDMPGGPHGGKPITPPKKKSKKKDGGARRAPD